MRCILGLCVVLAVGSPAWTTETDIGSPENALQDPSVSPAAPSSSLPAATAPSITNLGQAVTQPAPTALAPAPAMTTSASPAVGTQPGTTSMTSMSNTTSPTTYYRTGIFGRRYRMTTPVYSSSPMSITAGTSFPTQTYYTAPQQEAFYQPVRQRRGLLGIFQPRWRQQAVPVSTTTGSMTPIYYTRTACRRVTSRRPWLRPAWSHPVRRRPPRLLSIPRRC